MMDFAIALGFLAAVAGPPSQQAFPCGLEEDFRVISRTELIVFCRLPLTSPLDLPADVVDVGDHGQWNEATRREVRLKSDAEDRFAIRVTLEPGSAPLESNKTYALRTKPEYIVDGRAVAHRREIVTISTKPGATVTLNDGGVRHPGWKEYFLRSRVELDPSTFGGAVLKEELGTPGASGSVALEAVFCPPGAATPAVCGARSAEGRNAGEHPLYIRNPGPRELVAQLTLAGVKNVLGADVVIPPDQRVKLPVAPKDKESASFFVRFLHQVSEGGKPGYALDLKASPRTKNLGRGVFLVPALTADLGLETVDGVKPTDMIKAGVGVTKIVTLRGRVLQAVEATPVAGLETDRTGHRRNAMLDLDVRFFGAGWLRSISRRNEQAYAKEALEALRSGQPPPDPALLPSADFGYELQIYAGVETGRALSADDVKSSDKSSSVTRPPFGIARLRPKAVATLEWRQFSASATVVPRFLMARETVTRERGEPSGADPSKTLKTIFLDRIAGWQPYAEIGAAWSLDRAGHYALTTTLKAGRLPPNFERARSLLSGVTIRF